MDNQERQYEEIMVVVSVKDGRAIHMQVRSAGALRNVNADLIVAVDDERLVEWLYGQFDQVLTECRRLIRRGQFAGGREVGDAKCTS